MTNAEQIVRITPHDIASARVIIKLLEEKNIEFDYISDIPLSSTRLVPENSKYLTRLAFLFGCSGFILVILLQYWAGEIYYPMNIGNKPFFSWITSIPIAFETAILFAGVSAFISFFFKLRDNENNLPENFPDNLSKPIISIHLVDLNKVNEYILNQKIKIRIIEDND